MNRIYRFIKLTTFTPNNFIRWVSYEINRNVYELVHTLTNVKKKKSYKKKF